jgi:uncharacterized membrane protein
VADATNQGTTQDTTQVEHVGLLEGDAAGSVAAVRGHPIHPMLIPLPIGFLVAGLAADVAYWLGGDAFFARAAVLLIAGGVLAGLVAAAPGMVDWFAIRRARTSRVGQVHALGNAVLLTVAGANWILRTVAESAEAAVLPWGLALSLLSGALLLVTGWAGGEMSYRHLIGVTPVQAARRPHASRPE